MDSDGWLALVGVVIVSGLLGVGAMVETVVTRTSRSRVLAALGMPVETSGRQRYRLTTDPRHRLVAAMVLVQVVAAIVIAGLLTHVFADAGGEGNDWLAILVAILVYLVLGQVLPRALGEQAIEARLDQVINLGQSLAKLFSPLLWLVDRGVRLVRSWLPGTATLDDIEEIDDNRPSTRIRDLEEIGEVDRQMIDGILALDNMTVRDIMVPRLDIVAVERSVPSDELISTITKAGHSRIPVYQGSVDRILGVLYAKDLLPFVIGTTRRIPLLDLIRPAFVVPESKKVNDLFAELKRGRIHIAIVADEYGGTAGIITMEDLFEELIGDIRDEYDIAEPETTRLGGTIEVDGLLNLDDFEEETGVELPEGPYETVAGFLMHRLGRVLREGDLVEYAGHHIVAVRLDGRRLSRVRVSPVPEADPADSTTD